MPDFNVTYSFPQDEPCPHEMKGRELSKEATVLKRKKDWDAAIAKLHECFDELEKSKKYETGYEFYERLPYFMSLAGKHKEAFKLYKEFMFRGYRKAGPCTASWALRKMSENLRELDRKDDAEVYVAAAEILGNGSRFGGDIEYDNSDLLEWESERDDFFRDKIDRLKSYSKPGPFKEIAQIYIEEYSAISIDYKRADQRVREVFAKHGKPLGD